MQCETQLTAQRQGCCQGMCAICGQVTGCGLCHPCSPGDVQTVSQGRVDRAHSMIRSAVSRRKRNLSMLVGREGDEVQEQIVSGALSRIAERKGAKFRLKQMEGGGILWQGQRGYSELRLRDSLHIAY